MRSEAFTLLRNFTFLYSADIFFFHSRNKRNQYVLLLGKHLFMICPLCPHCKNNRNVLCCRPQGMSLPPCSPLPRNTNHQESVILGVCQKTLFLFLRSFHEEPGYSPHHKQVFSEASIRSWVESGRGGGGWCRVRGLVRLEH